MKLLTLGFHDVAPKTKNENDLLWCPLILHLTITCMATALVDNMRALTLHAPISEPTPYHSSIPAKVFLRFCDPPALPEFRVQAINLRTPHGGPLPYQLCAETTVCNDGHYRPMLEKIIELQGGDTPAFEFAVALPLNVPCSTATDTLLNGQSDHFEYFKQRARSQQLFASDMLVDSTRHSLFLLPCLIDLPESVAAVSKHKHIHSVIVFKAYVVDTTRLAALVLTSFTLPLSQHRMHAILDLDNTLLLSVVTEQATDAQLGASVSVFHARASHKPRILILRPGAAAFLARLSHYFQFSFCTMGSTRYALQVVDELRRLCPRVDWSQCVDVVSAKHTRSTQCPIGFKSTQMVHSFAAYPTLRDTCVVIDDSPHIWRDEKALVYCISPFYGPHPSQTPQPDQFALDAPMDKGLTACWNTLRRLHSLFFDSTTPRDDNEHVRSSVRDLLPLATTC